MKRLLVATALLATFVTANAYTTGQQEKQNKKAGTKKEMKKGKEHVCNSTCTKESHALKHGEKGHTCTEACHKKK